MGLSESIEKILLNNYGQLSIDKVYATLSKKYARQTILDFVQNEKSFISFDGETISLSNFLIQKYIETVEKFIKETHFERKNFLLMGAFFLYFVRHNPLSDNSEFPKIMEYNNYFEFPDSKLSLLQYYDLFLDQVCSEFDTDKLKEMNYLDFFSFSNSYFEYVISSSFGIREPYSTPDTLVELIIKIIPDKKFIRVYNPAAGMLKLLTAVNLHTEMFADASEINAETYRFANLFSRTNKFYPDLKNTDSIEESVYGNLKPYDLILSIPPFNAKLPNSPFEYKDVSLNIISKSLDRLKNKGTGLFVVTDSVLFSQSKDYIRFRKDIIEHELIKTVVSLPSGLFFPYSGVKTSILILEKKMDNRKIKFVDVSTSKFYSYSREKKITLDVEKIIQLINSSSDNNLVMEEQSNYGKSELVMIEYSKLKGNNYSLYGTDYYANKVQTDNPNLVSLAEVSTLLRLPLVKDEVLPYLRISDLNRSLITDISKLPINNSRSKGKILIESAILIGSVGGSSKPSLFNLNQAIEISTNIIALKVDAKKVLPEYLIQELNSESAQVQFDNFSKGSTSLRYLSPKDLLRIAISIPTLDEQHRLLQEREVFIQQQGLEKKTDNPSITDSDIFRTINHEIGNILKGPSGFIDLLPDFLSSNKINLDTPIVNAPGADSIGNMILMSERKIKSVFEVMENMKGILFSDKSYFKVESLDLKKYFNDKFKIEIVEPNILFHYGVSGNFVNSKPVIAEIDPVQFQYIVRNIVSNALNHSCIIQKDGQQLHLFVDVYPIKDKDKEEIEIHFMNNGNSFPAKFSVEDYIGFSNKSGSSKGQGLGGYLIKRVVDNHNGKLQIQSLKRFVEVSGSESNLPLEANVDVIITIPKKQ